MQVTDEVYLSLTQLLPVAVSTPTPYHIGDRIEVHAAHNPTTLFCRVVMCLPIPDSTHHYTTLRLLP